MVPASRTNIRPSLTEGSSGFSTTASTPVLARAFGSLEAARSSPWMARSAYQSSRLPPSYTTSSCRRTKLRRPLPSAPRLLQGTGPPSACRTDHGARHRLARRFSKGVDRLVRRSHGAMPNNRSGRKMIAQSDDSDHSFERRQPRSGLDHWRNRHPNVGAVLICSTVIICPFQEYHGHGQHPIASRLATTVRKRTKVAKVAQFPLGKSRLRRMLGHRLLDFRGAGDRETKLLLPCQGKSR